MAARVWHMIPAFNEWISTMADTEDGTKKQATPPYVSFPSLKNMIGGFKQHGLPGRIDRSVLGNFSGAVAGQLLTALKFLNLVQGEGEPNVALEKLVSSHGTDEWPAEIGDVIRKAYAPVFQLNLQTASPAQFNERFRSAYPMEGDTFRKCLTFFLHAVTDAQIQVSPYILKNKKPRANGTPRKPRPTKTQNGAAASRTVEQPSSTDGAGGGKPEPPSGNQNGIDEFKKELLGKFPAFDPSWPDAIKAEWFKSFEQFMAMAKK